MTDNGKAIAGVANLFGVKAKRRYKLIDLPVSGHRVRIQSLTERESSEYTMAVVAQRAGRSTYVRARLLDANCRLIAMCLVDADGNRLLADNQAGKIAAWDAADSGLLHDECAAHCGINRDEIEELAKNSEGIPVDSPPIDSPAG